MPRQHAYSVTNYLSGISDSAITIAGGASTTNRGRLVDGRVDKRYETGTETAWTVVFDLGSAISLDAFAVLNHNMAADGVSTIQVQSADDSAISVNVTSHFNGSINATDTIMQFGPSDARRFWKLSFSHASLNCKIGEIFAANMTAISRASIYGNGKAQVFRTTQSESDMGRMFGHFLSGPQTRLRLVWDDLSTAEKEELITMHAATRGNATDVLWAVYWDPFNMTNAYTDPREECHYGRFLEREIEPIETDYERWGGVSLTLQGQSRGVGL